MSNQTVSDVVFADEQLSSCVIGAAIEVHRHLGPGFLESAYEAAMCVELASRRISFAHQLPIQVEYKGHVVGRGQLDLIVENRLIIELKSVDALAPVHSAQLLSYLRATRLAVGLVINFNVTVLKQGLRRVVNSRDNE